MNIEALDDDCFKAILTRLSFEDFVLRAKLVSSRFYHGTELALDALIELKPLYLEVYGNCKHFRSSFSGHHPNFPEHRVPQIFLGGINIPPSKLSTLPNDCKYLANVSRVHLHAASCESLPPEFRAPLCEILKSLPPSAASLKYSPDTRGCYQCGYFDEEYHQPFFELAQHCTNWISTLETIDVPGAVPYTPKNRFDFFRLLTLSERLRSLTAEASLLFDVAGRFPSQPLAGLEKLIIDTRGNPGRVLSESIESCQNILETVCEHCPDLLEFNFTCYEPEDHACLRDFTVLQKLSKLRSFYISLRHENTYPLRIRGPLSSIESMTLYIPFGWPSCHLTSLMQMAPNLKSLRTAFVEQSELQIDDIIAMFTRQPQRCQLKFLSMWYHAVPSHLYPDFDKLLTLKSPISLRRVEWRNIGEYTAEQFNFVLSMISRTENVTKFELIVKWRQEVEVGQLQPLLRAMQRGSIRQLILHNGFVYDDTITFAKEMFLPLLPAGCEIREWNSTSHGCQPDSILISGYKLTEGAEAADMSREMFWVQIVL